MPRKSSSVQMAKATKPVKKIPATENGPGVHILTKSRKSYVVSWNKDKHKFTLWHETDAGYEKMATANSPTDLYPLVDMQS